MIAVAVVPSLFFKPARPPARPLGARDSAAAATASRDSLAPPLPLPTAATLPSARRAARPRAAPLPTAADTVSLTRPEAVYGFTSLGAGIDRAVLPGYRSFGRGDTGSVQLVRPGDRLLVSRVVLGTDTLRFDQVAFAAERGAGRVTFTGGTGPAQLRLTYAPVANREYLLEVTGELTGLEGRGALLVVGLGTGFVNIEADSAYNYRSYGLSTRARDIEVHNFRAAQPGEVQTIDGPFDWVALKSKYFIGVLLSPDSTRPLLGGAILVGRERENRTAKAADSYVTLPVGPDGRFRYQFYLGPQRHGTLGPIGRELERASPYGWIFQPIVMPVAGWITRLFLWMNENLRLSYGWVLVIFGVMVRLLLWPLNQKAMKSQVAMMAVQPLMQDLQKRYKNDPQKLQSEMMKLYKEHKVNPLGGCLPPLLPLPVLLALFFVFNNTIELRGAPFLWLPDLSAKDPLYIIPLVMGGSMFFVSKLSMAGMGATSNPQAQMQAKMMTYVLPVMMTVFFLNFASGLNLYYAVMNIVTLPQQWIINKARRAEMARRNMPHPPTAAKPAS